MNGEECDPISLMRGLRQGDPLSPLLFVLVMDVLQALVNKAISAGAMCGMGGRLWPPAISLYADDAVLFFRPMQQDTWAVKAILQLFGEATGLKANFAKSAITTIRCLEDQAILVQSILCCRLEPFPITYLGLPLSLRKLTKQDVQPLLDRFSKKFAGWKPKFLSTGDRLTLIKSVLFALPVHYLSVLELPQSAIKEIDRKCRGFLWKGQEEVSGRHCLVAWKSVCMPYEKGGLAIKNLNFFGMALRLKWLAKRGEHRDRPWTTVETKQPKELHDLFFSATRQVLGDGENTKFWLADWLPIGSIKARFPLIFSHVERKGLTVARGLQNHRWVRDIKGAPSNRGIGEYFQIWDAIQEVQLRGGEEDETIWKWASNGRFTPSSAYDMFLWQTQRRVVAI
ncbi:hypothetical protein OsJ_29192 [Oryza sativa Japonica Group]|uniref:Reverse transcriptase domain-containing protein n=1 Tax=Oryza sativa subsp. japonica TaxID=39947 RepID=B9G3B8_ORYSJ|nr:hypothetical protein OsJ_29192 [Oryza sativa Japonica Group]